MASQTVQTVNASTLYNDTLPRDPLLSTHTTTTPQTTHITTTQTTHTDTGIDTRHTEEYVKATPRAMHETEMRQHGTNVHATPFVSTQTYHGHSSTSTHLTHTPTHTTTLPVPMTTATTITETKHATPIVVEGESAIKTTNHVDAAHLPLPVHHNHHTAENHTLAHTLPVLSHHTEAHKHAAENHTLGTETTTHPHLAHTLPLLSQQTETAGHHHTESTQRQPDVVIGMQEELVGGLKKLAGKFLGSESLEMRGRTQIAKGKEEIVAAKAEKENYSPRFAKDSVVGGKESVSRDNNGLMDGNKSVSREYEERHMRAGTEPSANSLARQPLTPRQTYEHTQLSPRNHTHNSAENTKMTHEEVARGNIVTGENTGLNSSCVMCDK